LPRLPLLVLPVLMMLVACAERYTPDTYATRAVQQANKVEQGVVVGVRKVQISAEGSTGAAAGAAAGGVLGAQTPGGGIGQALGGVGGALVGGLIGKATESAAVDTPAYEYVVRTEKEDLLSVTQNDTVPLAIGQKVLVITGNQARVVPDYTVATAPRSPAREAAPARPEPPEAKPAQPAPEDPGEAAAAAVLQRMVPAPPGPPVLVPAPPAPRQGLSPGAAIPAIAGPVAATLVGSREPERE
jgi:outer membrane lipoprotein SlyB